MNSFVEDHKERLSHSIIVFGIAGLVFYTMMLITTFFLKFSAQILSVVKGMGL